MSTFPLQYQDCVVGPGSPRYDEAYFNVSYLRAYTSALPSPTTSSTATIAPATTTSLTTTTPTPGYSGSSGKSIESSNKNEWGPIVMLLIAAPIVVIGSWPLMFKKRHQSTQAVPPA
jgi:hypothetical protein